MYVNVARAALALVTLLAIQVLPAEAQSSVRFRTATPATPAAQQGNVRQTSGFNLQGARDTLGPPVQPPEILPPGGEVAPAPTGNGNGGTAQGEIIFQGCPTCNGGGVIYDTGCPTCPGEVIVGGPTYGGDCAMCNSGYSMCNHGCMMCNGGCGCHGGCMMNHCCGGCNHACGCCMTCGCRGGCGHGCRTGCGVNACCNPCDSCAPCGDDCGPCCDHCGPRHPWLHGCLDWIHHLFDDSQFFFAGDGWKNRLDDDDANNFGYRLGVNLGMPFLPERCIGLQLGASVGVYDLHGREDRNEGEDEGQGMLTIGLFKRCCLECCDCCTWAAVYDYQDHSNIGEDGDESINMGQFRFLLGRAMSECNEIGFWTAIAGGDTQFVDGNRIRGMSQFNVYCRHYWQQSGGDTSVYIGLAESPGSFVFGFNGLVPLSDRWALFGNAHYIDPSSSAGDPGFSEEVFNVTFGFVFYPGCNACPGSICGRQWMPVLPVADNGSFALAAPSHARF